ncbi:hypothetical protein IU500_34960 [Nocardia terpenica]|uniref:VC0807 family protein n=1 Tax=Nocardia terpenica TaxID=455432 RepID=UPI001893B4CE|nr:VC0807 family protein [Nocardia terpenica]MBF6066092.1 hypothetical protein [Nocardia terpenica]MBF6109217.1 hypothetical protein [Nocardia terpenica]MBF6116336.1 hypothetical protein [Nocardia terpenica]MBF6123493.1 hypothetical protein [Nocardia terpenica]MBF6156770.1 hypothetical protein [Nocardia terpenica]
MTVATDLPARPDRGSGRARDLLSLGLSIGLGLGSYYVFRAFGVSDVAALVASSIVTALWVLGVAVVRGRLDGLAAIGLPLNGLGLLIAFAGGDARLMLAKDPLTSAVLCVLLLGSLVVGRPAIFGISRRLHAGGTESARHWETLWHNDPQVRHAFRRSTELWAAGFAVDATIRLLMIYTLPLSVSVALMNVVQFTILGILAAFTFHTRRRLNMKGRIEQLVVVG